MKGYALSWPTELRMGIKDGMDDDRRIDVIMEYLRERAGQFCFNPWHNQWQSCSCLSSLDDDESYRNAVALYILWFATLEKQTQQVIIMEKIRGSKLVEEKRGVPPQLVFFLPYKTKLMGIAKELGNMKICKYALCALFRTGKRAWDTCRLAVKNGTIPEHGLKGKENVRSKKFKLETEPGLKAFFETVVLPLSGPRPTRFTREASGAVIRDLEEIKELDPEWTERHIYGKYCYDLGRTVLQSASSAVTVTE
jgi:hypothetical protein